ncbi:RNA methyltransferase [Acrasis kona]|uniref:RNA methyltransferase n=1 Tax=Acrasis kona TaxID=1008807 RepID=A0AAW2YLJ3_9EUKA
MTLIGKQTDIPFDVLWPVMVEKIYHPERFLPVTNVISKDVPKTDDHEAHVYREMTMGPRTIKERIFSDKEKGVMRFVNVENGETVYNAYFFDKKNIEYWKESKDGERMDLPIPPGNAPGPIDKTYEKAQEVLDKKKLEDK